MTVVDASVAVKWVVEEVGSDAARSLIADGEGLVAPDLIRVEVASALTRKARLSEISPEAAEEAVDVWLQTLAAGVVRLYATETDVRSAASISIDLRHAVPDCLYLALAERLDASLVTADLRFAGKASARFDRVQLLS